MDAKKGSPSLIGRERQIEELLKILDDVKDGKGKTVFVSGEPGIGKTSLIEGLISDTDDDDFFVIEGACRYDEPTPYQPIKEAWMDSGKEDLKGLISIKKGEDIEDKEMLDAYRNVAFYDNAQQLKRVSSEKPIIFFLDDMHLGDQGTLNLFHYLADRLQNDPIMFIGTYCPGDAVTGTPFIDMKQQMSRKKLFQEIELLPLNKDETGEMIRILTGLDDISDEFIDKVHEITEGLPLFIQESVIHIRGEEVDREDFEIPLLIHDVIERRIHRLSLEAREILQFGAVVGEKIPYVMLENVYDLDEFELLDHVDGLIENRLWCEGEDTENFYFSHNIVRNIVYEGIGKWIERVRLHQQVAEAMGNIHDDKRYNVLAYHLRGAERYDEAVKMYVKAGEEAKEVYSYEDAVEMYKEALSIFDTGTDVSTDKASILESLAEAYRLMGMYKKCRDSLNRGIQHLSNFDKEQRFYRKISESLKEQGEYERALEIAEGRLTFKEKDTLETCRLLSIKGWCLLFVGDHNGAVEAFEREREVAEEIGRDEEIAQAFHNLGSVYIKVGDFKNALNNLNTAKSIWEDIEDVQGLSKTLNNIAGLNSFTGNQDKALEQYSRCLELYKEKGNKPMEGKLYNNIGVIYYKKGQLEKAVEVLNEGLDITRQVDGRSSEANFLVNLGQVYIDMGELEEAEKHLDRGLELSEELEYLSGMIFARSILAQLKLEMDKIDEAEGYIEDVVRLSTKFGVKREEGIGKYLKGNLLRDREEWDGAVSMYEEALQLFERLGTLDYKGEVLYEYGVLCERVGEVDKAVEFIEQALDIFEDWGMDLRADRCREKLDEYS